MKDYLTEVAICTIVAAFATLFFYAIGLDSSWQEASATFGSCFLVMFVLGLWQRYKRNRQ